MSSIIQNNKREIFHISQLIALQDKVAKLTQQWNKMNETRGQRDITQEFSLRSKLRDIHHAHKVCFILKLFVYGKVILHTLGMGPITRTTKRN